MELIETDDTIFDYILNRNSRDDNDFVSSVISLENDIRKKINSQDLSDITNNYRNFSHDLTWIKNKYKELVIELVTENLITDKLLSFYKKN
mgnify:FL=1